MEVTRAGAIGSATATGASALSVRVVVSVVICPHYSGGEAGRQIIELHYDSILSMRVAEIARRRDRNRILGSHAELSGDPRYGRVIRLWEGGFREERKYCEPCYLRISRPGDGRMAPTVRRAGRTGRRT